jgi:surface antigen
MKMKNSALIILLLCLSIGSAGCQTTKAGGGAGLGVLGGAVAGQAVGKSTEATLIGAVLGGLLGYVVGNEMDKYDQQQINKTYETIPDQQTTTWVNPNTKKQYSATPQKTYKHPGTGQECRDVKILCYIDGKPEEMISSACRDARGQWQQLPQHSAGM